MLYETAGICPAVLRMQPVFQLRERAVPSSNLQHDREDPSTDVGYPHPSPFEPNEDSEDEEKYPGEMEYYRYVGECSV